MGIINRSFAVIRKFGSITIRVNDKNNRIPAPRVIYSNYRKKDKAIKAYKESMKIFEKEGIPTHWEKNPRLLGDLEQFITDICKDGVKKKTSYIQ